MSQKQKSIQNDLPNNKPVFFGHASDFITSPANNNAGFVIIYLDQVNISNELGEINKSIQQQSEQLSRLNTEINNAATPTMIWPIIIGITVALASALSAFFFNILQEKLFRRKENAAGLAKTLFQIVESLETLATNYWLVDYSADLDKKLAATEIKIKANFKSLTMISSCLIHHLNNDNEQALADELEEFLSQLFDVVTGDDFESKGRLASRSKVQSIAFRISVMNSKISAYSLSL